MSSHAWLSSALRDVTRVDRSKLSFARAARDALGVAAPLAGGVLTDNLMFGLLVSLGALNISLFDRPGADRHAARWMVAASFGAAVSVFVGAATGTIDWLAIVLAALWAFAAGLLITIGPTASQVGLVSIIMLLVLAHEPLPPEQALVAAGAVLLGGLLEVLVVAIPWPRRAEGGRTAIGSPRAAAAPLPPNPSLSAALHHALRVAVAVAVADTLARGLKLPHGYWIPMTVAIVLKPAVGATITRSLSRLLGTLTGLVLGTLLLETAFGPIAAHIVLFGVFVFLMLAFGPGNYALLVVAVSAIVVVMFSLLGTPPAATMHDRAIATVIGGVLALLASLAWPARRGRGTAPAAPGESRHGDAAAQAPPRS